MLATGVDVSDDVDEDADIVVRRAEGGACAAMVPVAGVFGSLFGDILLVDGVDMDDVDDEADIVVRRAANGGGIGDARADAGSWLEEDGDRNTEVEAERDRAN